MPTMLVAQSCRAEDCGSKLCGFKSHLRYYTPIAQLVLEQQTFNLWVLGSNPNGGTYASLVQWIEQDTSNV